jgi:hypothetical protein
VILALFASWCEPCADQAGAVRALARRYAGDAEVAALGIAVNDQGARTLAFLADHPMGVTPLRAGHTILGTPAVPETLVLDREGRIAFRLAGALVNPATVEREVEALR